MSKLTIEKTGKTGASMRKPAAPKALDLGTAIKSVAKRGADLGNGFYLIEVDGRMGTQIDQKRQAKAPQGYKLPGITALPQTEIEHVLNRFQGSLARFTRRTDEKIGVPKTVTSKGNPNVNKALLSQFAAHEQVSIGHLAEVGQLIDSKEMAERLRVKPQAVTKAIRELRMFSLEGASGKQWIPAFFADAGLERKQLESVSKVLGQLPGTSKWQFFTMPRLQLSKKTPIDALRKGKVEEVIKAAKAFAEA